MKESLSFGCKVLYTATGEIGTLIGKDAIGYQVHFEGDWKPFRHIPRAYLKRIKSEGNHESKK